MRSADRNSGSSLVDAVASIGNEGIQADRGAATVADEAIAAGGKRRGVYAVGGVGGATIGASAIIGDLGVEPVGASGSSPVAVGRALGGARPVPEFEVPLQPVAVSAVRPMPPKPAPVQPVADCAVMPLPPLPLQLVAVGAFRPRALLLMPVQFSAELFAFRPVPELEVPLQPVAVSAVRPVPVEPIPVHPVADVAVIPIVPLP